MELFEYYNLDECIDRKLVLSKLNELKEEGKIEYELNVDILKIEDIDLDETEIDELAELLEENDVFEDLDRDSDDWDDEGWGDDSFDNEDDYLRHITYQGAEKRYKDLSPEIRERIDFELDVIKNTGYPGYFLIVEDLVILFFC